MGEATSVEQQLIEDFQSRFKERFAKSKLVTAEDCRSMCEEVMADLQMRYLGDDSFKDCMKVDVVVPTDGSKEIKVNLTFSEPMAEMVRSLLETGRA